MNSTKDAGLNLFLASAHVNTYPRKTIILNAGVDMDSIYCVVEGTVSIFGEDASDHRIVLFYLDRGRFFGEAGFFFAEKKSLVLVRAKTRCVIAKTSYNNFEKLVGRCPQLLTMLTVQLVERERNITQKILDMAFLDLTERTKKTLRALAQRPEAITHPEGMQINVTRIEVSRILGCNREVVGHIFTKLEKTGFIKNVGRSAVVLLCERPVTSLAHPRSMASIA